jgi:hypothetical protein
VPFRRGQARGEYLRTAQGEVAAAVPVLSGDLVSHQMLNVRTAVNNLDGPWRSRWCRRSVRGTAPMPARHGSTSGPVR